jgi:hypothetical protein
MLEHMPSATGVRIQKQSYTWRAVDVVASAADSQPMRGPSLARSAIMMSSVASFVGLARHAGRLDRGEMTQGLDSDAPPATPELLRKYLKLVRPGFLTLVGSLLGLLRGRDCFEFQTLDWV